MRWLPPRRSLVLGTTVVLAFVCGSLAAGVPQRKVLIVGIDGCRPDALRLAHTPHLDQLAADGAADFEVQTQELTRSGPAWSSLLTGVWHEKHGVIDNLFTDAHFDQYPHFFFRLRERCTNVITASIVGWMPINGQIPSPADFKRSGLIDAGIAQEAADFLTRCDADVVFVHFLEVDSAGHQHGFSPTSEPYLAAIEAADEHLGVVLEAVRARPTYDDEDWLILVTTDHGGLGTHHGGTSPEETTVFFIVSGAAADPAALGPQPGLADVPATVFTFLGLEIDPLWDWDGEPVGLRQPLPPGMFPCELVPGLVMASGFESGAICRWTPQPGPPADLLGPELPDHWHDHAPETP